MYMDTSLTTNRMSFIVPLQENDYFLVGTEAVKQLEELLKPLCGSLESIHIYRRQNHLFVGVVFPLTSLTALKRLLSRKLPDGCQLVNYRVVDGIRPLVKNYGF